MDQQHIAVAWSGGIDSTALIARLLGAGWAIDAVALTLPYGEDFIQREREARYRLMPHLDRIAKQTDGRLTIEEHAADWLLTFSPDGREVPRRNKHILDWLITRRLMPANRFNVGLGEYIGADTWLVRDHVGAHDADARALAAYLYAEYGLPYRLITLADFGESRYKQHRVALGWELLEEAMFLTTNCLADVAMHCGACYKCVERRAAFSTLGIKDETPYAMDPAAHDHYSAYLLQMQGRKVELSGREFGTAPMMGAVLADRR